MFVGNNAMSVSFDEKNLNIRVENSYLFHSKNAIKIGVEYIISLPEFQKIRNAGFTRTEKSMINEWIAHNFLYYKGYQKNRTGSVDIDQAEPRWRRFVYWILAKLYRDPLK